MVCQGLDRSSMQTKLSSLISNTHRSFASVCLAFSLFSLFGFLFPHHRNEVKPNHQVNLKTTEQATDREPADDGSVYEWFY
jgi:hypothetical protein